MEEKWREEEKKRAAKALADQMVVEAEKAQRSEEAWRSPVPRVVVPQSVGVILSSEWVAHQFALEVAHVWEKMPKASGNGSITNIALDLELEADAP